MSARNRALAVFEETSHYFQFLNGGPFSKTGLRIEKGLAAGDPKLNLLGVRAG